MENIVREMPKNISIYVTDELLQKMDRFPEVNWSEIARKGIEDYISGRTKNRQQLVEVERVIEESRYLMNKLRNQIKEGTITQLKVVDTEDILIESNLLFGTQKSEISIEYKIRNFENMKVIFDRMLYEVQISVQGLREPYRHKGSIMEPKEMPERGRHDVIGKIELPSKEVFQKISLKAQESETDVTFNITANAFFLSPKGILHSYHFDRHSKAFSHWKKWYNSWADKEGLTVIQ